MGKKMIFKLLIKFSFALIVGYIAFLYAKYHLEEKCGFREGDTYVLCKTQKVAFENDGLGLLPGLLTEAEIVQLEEVYMEYMRNGDPEKQGKDFCDMSKPFDTPRENYSVINAMLPSRYYPQLKNNIYERVARSVAAQLFPDVDMEFDYDQLLDKRPKAEDAVFAWHQDMAYWPTPAMTPDTRTVTFSLAFDSTTIENGCIRYVPGSGKEKLLREHKSVAKSREEGHAVSVEVGDEEVIRYAQVPRGSASIHDEYVVHGSGGNLSNKSRRTYVIAFRTKDTVERERQAGFSHSHNDEVNWDKFNSW